jgi:hypothetical protein
MATPLRLVCHHSGVNYVGVEPHTVVAAAVLAGSVLFVLAITLLGVTASTGSQVNWRPAASFGSVEQTLEFVGNVVLFAPSGS